jgi:SAM-dependent methyltransferase
MQADCDKAIAHEALGLGFPAGGMHYRAYVGPPADYDLIAAMTFNLLTTIGLRAHHRLLDIGCGSLRIGRLLIPYLNRGNYTGVEPNAWLVEDGIRHELGAEAIQLKAPVFHYGDTPALLDDCGAFDFVVAQSIFSHCGPELIASWLQGISPATKGAMLATFLIGEKDCTAPGWHYPECVNYRPESMRRFAEDAGFRFRQLDWRHPRQTWGLFCKPSFDDSWFVSRPLTWNNWMDYGPR